MAIDTVAKRKSVINNGIPGIHLLPPPDALIQAVDRRALSDFYGLGSQVVARSFWVPDRRDAVIFSPDERTSTTWVQDQDSTGNWKEESEVSLE